MFGFSGGALGCYGGDVVGKLRGLGTLRGLRKERFGNIDRAVGREQKEIEEMDKRVRDGREMADAQAQLECCLGRQEEY